jgi:hypothetical protein
MKNENLTTVLAALTAEKAPLTGENLGSLVEAIFADNGDKALTNAQVNELTSTGGVLAGKLSAAQLRGKAVSAGYYAKKTEAEKAKEHGTSQTRKSEFVSTLETLVSAPAGSFESLGKAKKAELEDLAKRLIAMSEQQAADNGQKS